LHPGKERETTVSICPGEGVGPQLVDSVLQVFDYLRVPVKVDMIDYSSLKRGKANGQLTENKNILLGPISNKTFEERQKGICHKQILKELDIFASVLNPISIPGVDTNGVDMDLLIIRHADKAFQLETKKCYREKCQKIAQYAFNNAMMGNRNKVYAFHQANIFNECHEEFLSKMRKIAQKSKSIEYEEILLSDGAVELIKNPEAFELIVMPGNCGEATTSIAMSLVGGHQLVPSVHIGDEYSIFEQGGNKPDYVNENKLNANPTGLILASTMMLRQINMPIYSDQIERAVFTTYENPEVRTPDLGGNYSTKEFTEKLINNIEIEGSRSQLKMEEDPLPMGF